jgi:hypothetical protein
MYTLEAKYPVSKEPHIDLKSIAKTIGVVAQKVISTPFLSTLALSSSLFQ